MATRKKTARKGSKKTAAKGGRVKHDDKALTPQVVQMRKDGETWAAIGEALSITPGKAQYLHMVKRVKPAERIKFETDEELAEQVIEARDEELQSWGWISARARVPEGKIKKLYGEHGGSHKPGKVNVASERAALKAEEEGSTKKPARRKSAKKGSTKKPAAKKGARKRPARKGKGAAPSTKS